MSLSLLVLWKADAPFNDIEQQAEELAISSKSLAVVSDSYIYNGNKPYVTVFGVDEYGKEKAIFVPISLDENIDSGSIFARRHYGRTGVIGY